MAPLLYFAAAESHLHFETRSFSPLGGLLSQSDSGAKFMRSLAHNNAGERVEKGGGEMGLDCCRFIHREADFMGFQTRFQADIVQSSGKGSRNRVLHSGKVP